MNVHFVLKYKSLLLTLWVLTSLKEISPKIWPNGIKNLHYHGKPCFLQCNWPKITVFFFFFQNKEISCWHAGHPQKLAWTYHLNLNYYDDVIFAPLQVGSVTAICFTCFLIRCFVIFLSAFDADASLDVLDHPVLNLIYYMLVEILPSALVLFILRKLPPKRISAQYHPIR